MVLIWKIDEDGVIENFLEYYDQSSEALAKIHRLEVSEISDKKANILCWKWSYKILKTFMVKVDI